MRFPAILAALALPAPPQEMREFTDGAGRTVEIPAAPQRIVSLRDFDVTLPFVELGAPVVGSHGRQDGTGAPYLRSVDTILDIDFDNSDITCVGNDAGIDYEAIAALGPDLIIGRWPNDEERLGRIEQIAPTMMIDVNQGSLGFIRDLADVPGVLPADEEMRGD